MHLYTITNEKIKIKIVSVFLQHSRNVTSFWVFSKKYIKNGKWSFFNISATLRGMVLIGQLCPLRLSVCLSLSVCMYVYTYMYIYTYVYVYIYVCMYI